MILYPELLQHNVKLNPVWTNIIERVSIGDTPFGTHIFNNTLYYKQHSISLLNCGISDLVNFFVEYVGLKLEYIHFDKWKEIKRKIIKDNLIMDFVTRMGTIYSLDSSQCRYLLSLIHLYITLKKITPNDIILEIDTSEQCPYPHTYIKSINRLLFDITDPTVHIRFLDEPFETPEFEQNIDELDD